MSDQVLNTYGHKVAAHADAEGETEIERTERISAIVTTAKDDVLLFSCRAL